MRAILETEMCKATMKTTKVGYYDKQDTGGEVEAATPWALLQDARTFDPDEAEVMLTTSMKISVHPAPAPPPQFKLMAVSPSEVPLT